MHHTGRQELGAVVARLECSGPGDARAAAAPGTPAVAAGAPAAAPAASGSADGKRAESAASASESKGDSKRQEQDGSAEKEKEQASRSKAKLSDFFEEWELDEKKQDDFDRFTWPPRFYLMNEWFQQIATT